MWFKKLSKRILPGFCMLVFTLFYWGIINAQEAGQNSQVKVDSMQTSEDEYKYLRGIERDKKEAGEGTRTAANALLFIPRTIIDGLLFSTGYGAHLVDDTKFVEKIGDFVYLYQRRIGWYPVLAVGSGTAYGATVFYRAKPFGISAAGYYGNSELWQVKINLLHAFLNGNTVWRINLSGKIKKRADYEYYGFGSDPENDSRNSFKPGVANEFGLYSQQLSRAQLVIGMRPSPKWQIFYSGFYQERSLEIPEDVDDTNIDKKFDLDSVPGIRQDAKTTGKQVYNEIALRYDTRKYRGQISPGIRIEGYGGISVGVGDDESRFVRSGVDAAFYIPVIKQTRLVVPRIIFDMVENINDDVELSFADYPRQPAFRGISRKSLLRTDEISLVPSLEYQWPLSFSLRGHLFADYLLVSDSISHLTLSNAPYALGFGIDLHSADSELARFTITTGSEGLRVFLTVGLSGHSNDRTKWE